MRSDEPAGVPRRRRPPTREEERARLWERAYRRGLGWGNYGLVAVASEGLAEFPPTLTERLRARTVAAARRLERIRERLR